tara:strand:+ start:23441 stop:24409 length:969 start_codon:yes stop_codon:yes gene_type:complete
LKSLITYTLFIFFAISNQIAANPIPEKNKIACNTVATKPNVLMLILDDLNDYVGVMKGHPQAKTPNIDQLAKESVLFNNAHFNVPICSPSRASFMHGISPLKSKCWGFSKWEKNEILMNSKSIPKLFRDNRYKAYQTGKVFHTEKKGAWDETGVFADYGPLAYDGKKVSMHSSCPIAMQELGPLDATFASLADIPVVEKNKNALGYMGWYSAHWKINKPIKYTSDEDRDLLKDEKNVAWFQNKIKQLEKAQEKESFLIAVGLIRPHTSIVVPQKYFDMFPLEKVKIPVLKSDGIYDTKLAANTLGRESRGSKAFRTLNNLVF